MRLQSEKGFTLVEMVIAMAVFVVVIMMVGTSFSTLLKYSKRYMKSEESNIEGNVGLELLRHDIASAGFGLPASFTNTINYREAANDPGASVGTPLNDSPSKVPRPIAGLNSLGTGLTNTGNDGFTYSLLAGSDYLALKATSLGVQSAPAANQQPAIQKWTYALYSSAATSQRPKAWPTGNLQTGDQVIAMIRSSSSANGSFQLLNGSGNQFSTTMPASGGLNSPFNPTTNLDTAYIYGLSSAASTVRMPFNRVDYFVAQPPPTSNLLPKYCSPNTGILYRGVVHNTTDGSGGNLDYEPVLDCVAAMHVVLGWDTTGSGSVDTWSKVDGTGTNSSTGQLSMQGAVADAAQVNQQLKVVKVYLLAQIGKLDPGYTSPVTFNLYSEEGQTTGAVYNLQAKMLNYRWKVYKLILRPKNLLTNQ